MSINYKIVSNILGLLLFIFGLAMLSPLAIALICGELSSAYAFLFVSFVCLISGFITFRLTKNNNKKIKLRDAILIVTLSWVFAGFIGGLPYILSGSIPNPIEAFFEACSGFSTTGSTILKDIEKLPRSILFWRSFTHWLGGMGILVFAVAVMPALGISGQTIVSIEAPGPKLSKISPKMSDTARHLYILYFSFTIAETALLMFGGMSLYDALCHSFSTLGTGGFSNYNNSIAHFNSPYIEMVITVFMFLAGINFNLYFIVFKTGIKQFFKDGELKLYVIITLTTTTLIALNLYISGNQSIFDSIRYGLFQEVSILTTTGFMTDDYVLWPTFAQALLLCLFFIGGSSSSTSGGIKVIRILVLLKMVKRSIALRLHPNAVVNIKLNGLHLSSDIVSNIASFLFVYVGLLFFGAFLISFDGLSLISSLSAAATCLGNIGPGFEQLGPTSNFSEFSSPSKFILSLLMLAGRLEVFPFLMIFSRRFWNPYR